MPHSSSLSALTTAMFDKLNVAAITTTLSCGVYAYVPQNPALPYLRIGSATETKLDAMGRAGKNATVQVHIFTSADAYEGDGQAQAILSKVIELLHYVTFTLTGYAMAHVEYDNGFDAGPEDINGVRYPHFVATFRARLRESA